MATGVGTILEISMRMRLLTQDIFNVWQYRITTWAGTPDASELGEAWWDEVKVDYRAMVASSLGPAFIDVLVKDISDPLGIYGTFAVPSLEQAGTRNPALLSQLLPTFVATRVKLQVATRATKPGSKRIGFMWEEDNLSNTVQPGFLSLVTSFMNNMSGSLSLAAPAAGVFLQPVVVSKGTTGLAVAEQNITGYTITSKTGSQVSRREN